ncbi:MAG: hypothetical protein ACK474_01045, partial [Pseudanabaena sp.]
ALREDLLRKPSLKAGFKLSRTRVNDVILTSSGLPKMQIEVLQQFSIKRTTRYFLKGLRSNPFRKYLGLVLSAMRCK